MARLRRLRGRRLLELEGGDEREAGRTQKLPRRVADVLDQSVHAEGSGDGATMGKDRALRHSTLGQLQHNDLRR